MHWAPTGLDPARLAQELLRLLGHTLRRRSYHITPGSAPRSRLETTRSIPALKPVSLQRQRTYYMSRKENCLAAPWGCRSPFLWRGLITRQLLGGHSAARDPLTVGAWATSYPGFSLDGRTAGFRISSMCKLWLQQAIGSRASGQSRVTIDPELIRAG